LQARRPVAVFRAEVRLDGGGIALAVDVDLYLAEMGGPLLQEVWTMALGQGCRHKGRLGGRHPDARPRQLELQSIDPGVGGGPPDAEALHDDHVGVAVQGVTRHPADEVIGLRVAGRSGNRAAHDL
jgi:hypothetical protein